jgi:glucose-6-phosphate dehydrogenase assembly protein OpcA
LLKYHQTEACVDDMYAGWMGKRIKERKMGILLSVCLLKVMGEKSRSSAVSSLLKRFFRRFSGC